MFSVYMDKQKPYICEKRTFFKVDSPLLKFKQNISSQCGEDGIIEQVFKVIEPVSHYFVEFGAWDGKHLSNCYNLASNKDWHGAFIEGNAKKFDDLLAIHGSNEKIQCINSFVEIDGDNKLDSILQNAGAPANIDLISIDVDGLDWFIWASLEAFRPQLIVIEFNPTIPNDVSFVQAKDSSISHGCSLLSLVELGKSKGYELICCTAWNAFFVPKELFPLFEIKNNFLALLYQPIQDGRIFCGYDSCIHIAGMDRLLWGNVVVSSEDFQILPKSLRRWGDAQSH